MGSVGEDRGPAHHVHTLAGAGDHHDGGRRDDGARQSALTPIPSGRNSSAMPSTHMLIPYFAIVYAT